MGKVTHRGWYNSSDEIPEPTSVVLGRNLRGASEPVSKRPKPAPASPEEGLPPEVLLSGK
jgi:hypothetical protein